MCGRYVLYLRPSEVRQRLADQDMPADEAPSDDDPRLRQSYNFAPGYHGLIYRAATNDRGTDATPLEDDQSTAGPSTTEGENDEPSRKKAKLSHPSASPSTSPAKPTTIDGLSTRETKYKLQSAKWGLIPFWTKRPPDYGSMLRTINCRDDSLAQSGGMWTTMKHRKRCIVIAEGFYEWLKKNNGKDRVPHFVRRKDGGLMCWAGLWDCVKYEDDSRKDEEGGKDAGDGEDKKKEKEGEGEKLYTYTIITTDSNKQLTFLHDRMPVILEPGSEEMRQWLDPSNIGWNKDLQSMLKPFQGELECYQVDKAVGKVGNNSPNFVIPIDSKENKKNIANFFSGAQKVSPKKPSSSAANNNATSSSSSEIKKEPTEPRETSDNLTDPESNAPLPIPKQASQSSDSLSQAIKRDADAVPDEVLVQAADEGTDRNIKREQDELGDEDLLEAEKSPPRHVWSSPSKDKSPASARSGSARKGDDKGGKGKYGDAAFPSTPSKTRSATRNSPTVTKTPTKSPGEGNKKITAFFGGK